MDVGCRAMISKMKNRSLRLVLTILWLCFWCSSSNSGTVEADGEIGTILTTSATKMLGASLSEQLSLRQTSSISEFIASSTSLLSSLPVYYTDALLDATSSNQNWGEDNGVNSESFELVHTPTTRDASVFPPSLTLRTSSETVSETVHGSIFETSFPELESVSSETLSLSSFVGREKIESSTKTILLTPSSDLSQLLSANVQTLLPDLISQSLSLEFSYSSSLGPSKTEDTAVFSSEYTAQENESSAEYIRDLQIAAMSSLPTSVVSVRLGSNTAMSDTVSVSSAELIYGGAFIPSLDAIEASSTHEVYSSSPRQDDKSIMQSANTWTMIDYTETLTSFSSIAFISTKSIEPYDITTSSSIQPSSSSAVYRSASVINLVQSSSPSRDDSTERWSMALDVQTTSKEQETKYLSISPSKEITSSYASLLSSSTLRHQPTVSTSSSATITTVSAPSSNVTLQPSTVPSRIYQSNLSFELSFSGDCDPLLQRKIILEEFWQELVFVLAIKLNIDRHSIKPKDIACNPIRLSILMLEVDARNMSSRMKDAVIRERLTLRIPVPTEETTLHFDYKAVSIKEVPLTYDLMVSPEMYEIGLSEVDIVVIIVASCISFILVLVGCCICAREYYIRRRTRKFDVSNIASLNANLEDYTLTKIPRPKAYYGVDNGVKMRSFTRTDGIQTQALLEQEETENTSSPISDFRIRMKEHAEGIVIGVTTIPEKSYEKHDKTSHSNSDESKQKLCTKNKSPTHYMDNPIYYADDDSNPTV